MQRDLHAAGGPRRLTVVTNPDECNLACPMCREHSRHAVRPPPAPPRRLRLEQVQRILDELRASGLQEVIPSTKGEPLLWPGLDGLARLCHERGLLLNVT